MSGISTHVLDAAKGTPATGIEVRLLRRSTGEIAAGTTDEDGRISDVLSGPIDVGSYRLEFDTGAYYAKQGVPTFYPEVSISFTVTDSDAHHHVPLLLSPYAYSTYRGS